MKQETKITIKTAIIIITIVIVVLQITVESGTELDFILVTNGFQDPATTLMEEISKLYDKVMYYLYIVVFVLLSFFIRIILIK